MYWTKCKVRGCMLRDRGSFVPLTYLAIALDRGWYKVLIWHNCSVPPGANVWILFCFCMSVCVSMNAC